MALEGVDPRIPLGILTVVGFAFAYLGYDLFDLFLSWVGGIGGAIVGGAIGWIVLPSMGGEASGQPRLLTAGVLALIGGILGWALLSFLTRFAVVAAAFVATTMSSLLVFVGPEVFRPEALPEGGPPTDPETIQRVIRIEALLEGETKQLVLISLVVGGVGGALAWRFYPVVIAAATSVFGAALLGLVIPLWQQGAITGGELVFDPDQMLNGWTGIVLITGFALQSYRHVDLIRGFVDRTLDIAT